MGNPNCKFEDGRLKIKINKNWFEPKFEKYEEIEPIGEPGANGVVVRGVHKITERTDAIKIWLPRKIKGEVQIRKEQYLAEVKKIAKLNDSRFAAIHDAWIEGNCFCYSMEYIKGCTYHEWLKHNYNIDKRVAILMKIFEAINAFQSNGIIHGDIHWNNILIDESEKIHIIDFGASVISSYKDQSIHRENYLMYELVEDTLGEQFDPEVFDYKKYDIKGKISKDDDVRSANPLFFSKSVICYLKLWIMLKMASGICRDMSLLYEYCRYIAEGYYININWFYRKVSKDEEGYFGRFGEILYNAYEDIEYENAQNNADLEEKVLYVSLYVYYEKMKEAITKGPIDKRDVEDLWGRINFDNSIMELFEKSEDLFEFHKGLTLEFGDETDTYLIETNLRSILYELLEKIYEGSIIYVLKEIRIRMDEIKYNEELFDKIVKLSWIYRCNNGIEEYEC